MKVGKLPENVLKRAVLKKTNNVRKEVLIGAGVGEDCAALKLAEDEALVISTDPITGTAKDIGKLSVYITVDTTCARRLCPHTRQLGKPNKNTCRALERNANCIW